MRRFYSAFYLKAALAALFLLVWALPAHAAQADASVAALVNGLPVALGPGESVDALLAGGEIVDLNVRHLDHARVIVQFRDAPLARAALRRASELRARADRLAARHAAFKSDLTEMANARRLARGESPITADELVRRDFTRAFNGAACTLPGELVARVRELPYVARVYPDREAKACLDVSVPLIGGNAVWSDPGVHGEGMVVAVIDTGVDYTHPDLAGRVILGPDYVNGDADPMDDHGHGTHCAGIVAADGTRVGVAPAAQIMALKVLNASGSGSYSDIMAAIDYCLDPDGDPGTDDAVDVASLSLGGPGDPDDAISQAVNAASDAGVAMVIAAGNDYNYFRIGSPGCADKAITVGATDDSDQMAAFSSRGPTSTFTIKPDVTAPGVSICSSQWADAWAANACLDDDHTAISGTSMATPHVAGAAALLLQQHPEWTPDQVKSVLMGTALDLGFDANAQGAGRIRLVRAMNAKARVWPASVSFGLDDLSQGVWTASRSLTVTNMAAEARTYELSVTPATPAGLAVSLTPADEITVPAGGAAQILLEISVDNGVLPSLTATPYAYWGRVELATPAQPEEEPEETLGIPFSLIKSDVLRVVLDDGDPDNEYTDAPYWVMVHNGAGSAWSTFLDEEYSGQPVDFLVPAGDYDVIVQYRYDGTNTVVIHEGVQVSQLSRESVSKAEAVHTVSVGSVDENGDPVNMMVGAIKLTHLPSGTYSWSHGGGFYYRYRTNRFNTVSSDYAFEFQGKSRQTDRDAFIFMNGVKGISGNVDLTNAPGDLAGIPVEYAAPAGTQEFNPVIWTSTDPTAGAIIAGANWNNYDPLLTPPFVQDLHIQSPPYEGFGLAWFHLSGNPGYPDNTPRLYTSLTLARNQDPSPGAGLDGYVLHQAEPRAAYSGSLVLGLGPAHPSVSFAITNTEARLYAGLGSHARILRNQSFDYSASPPLAYELYELGELVASGELEAKSTLAGAYYLASLPGQGSYAMVLPYSYLVSGQTVQGLMTASFDTRAADPNPPCLSGFRLAADAGPAALFTASESALALFSLSDDSELSEVALAWRPNTGGDWTPLELALADGRYTAALPQETGTIDLKLSATDASGNSLACEMPAAYTREASAQAVICPAPFLLLLLSG